MKRMKQEGRMAKETFIDDISRERMKEDFKRRLSRGLAKKSWRQADLARHTGLGKDSISKYMSGAQIPTPGNIEKLAQSLNMAPHELWPNYDGTATPPTFTQRVERDPKDPTYAFIDIKARIRYASALAINQIIDGEIENAANAG